MIDVCVCVRAGIYDDRQGSSRNHELLPLRSKSRVRTKASKNKQRSSEKKIKNENFDLVLLASKRRRRKEKHENSLVCCEWNTLVLLLRIFSCKRDKLASGSLSGIGECTPESHRWVNWKMPNETRFLSYLLEAKTLETFALFRARDDEGCCCSGEKRWVLRVLSFVMLSGTFLLASWIFPGIAMRQSSCREMSRRALKIATRKAAQSLRRDKINNRISKEVAKAVREGGANTASNLQLAAVLQRARELNVSKEIIERNMKKAKDTENQSFSEILYEVFGYGGVGIVVEVLTDNPNRSSCQIREVVKKCRAKMAGSGSVLFDFKRAGVLYVKAAADVSADELFVAATDAGAEDVIEPPEDEEASLEDRVFKVITKAEDYIPVKSKLVEAGFPVGVDSGLELVSNAQVEVDDEAMELNKGLMEKLLELDDVDAVYSSQKA
ncbi:probable transcriptional regulatory protein At2g25830 isoform X2 [Selaginella moellendorffii]|uniref:probable transcriptional regulatory protein At2g25830 isoform X2 n=1 Tax=Selaginella moellendorffii TaxID=88036 RepID=UPI000D1CD3C7|nr:probable transcriptional regulatory protein At2g25830 isoform X2 [Selaginella moellendorffii]|eukprot:XP_024533237.1 probable transcriptional regulatory protein At2g25830 isoform X2 [Selaginella moellendorffii]